MQAITDGSNEPSDLHFLSRLFALPAVHDAFYLASNRYHVTKTRHQLLNRWFGMVEEGVRKAVVTAHYITTPVVRQVGGWQTMDFWACRGLDKLEEMAPIITKPTQEIKQTVLLKIQEMLQDEDDDDDYLTSQQVRITEIDNDSVDDDIRETETDSSMRTEEDMFQLIRSEDTVDADELLEATDQRNPKKSIGNLGEDTVECLELTKKGNITSSGSSSASLKESVDVPEKLPWWRRIFRFRRNVSAKTGSKTDPKAKNKEIKDKEGQKIEGQNPRKGNTESRNTEGCDKGGHDIARHNTEDYNTEGHNTEGRNTEGRNTEGRNTEGRNTEGRDIKRCDTESRDTESHDTEGHDTEGHDTGEGRGTEGEGSDIRCDTERQKTKRKDTKEHNTEGHNTESHDKEGQEKENETQDTLTRKEDGKDCCVPTVNEEQTADSVQSETDLFLTISDTQTENSLQRSHCAETERKRQARKDAEALNMQTLAITEPGSTLEKEDDSKTENLQTNVKQRK